MSKKAIETVRQAAQTLGFEQAILICIDNNGGIVASSWGANRQKCDAMGMVLDHIMDNLERDE